MKPLRIAFAGDREISVRVLDFMLQQGIQPLALLTSSLQRASHAKDLIELCAYLPPAYILQGDSFRQPSSLKLLRDLNLDYMVSIHFPYIIPPPVLEIPREGVINLHPAYLPFNRGWHTPSWAILENTPIGATLHFMDIGVDTGDIIHQREIDVLPGDTANTLYQRINQLEFEVFQEAWPRIQEGNYERLPQEQAEGTAHRRQELFSSSVQCIDLDAPTTAAALLRRLRALTTNRLDEAAYYKVGGKRFRVQILIHEEPDILPSETHV